MSREEEDGGETVGHAQEFMYGSPRAAGAGCLTSLHGICLHEPPAGKQHPHFANRETEDGE